MDRLLQLTVADLLGRIDRKTLERLVKLDSLRRVDRIIAKETASVKSTLDALDTAYSADPSLEDGILGAI